VCNGRRIARNRNKLKFQRVFVGFQVVLA
jgi:hypothetical protein